MRGEIVTNLLLRHGRLEEIRYDFEGGMQMAYNYVNPRRYDIARTASKGAIRRTQMYDGVAQDAFFSWVEGMIGWGVSEANKWMRAAITDRKYREIDAIQKYLDEYAEQMEWELQAGNFYDVHPELLQDAGSGGTGVITTDESKDLTHAVHNVPHPGSYYISSNGEHVYDIYHQIVPMTARDAYNKFNEAKDTLPAMIVEWAKDAQKASWECDFLVTVCPADDPSIFPKNVTVGRKKFAITTILYGVNSLSGLTPEMQKWNPNDRLIRIEGKEYFSPTIWPMRKNSDEDYGYSPAMDVMTMIEVSQQHGKNLLDLGNFAARPLLNVPKESMGFPYIPGTRIGFGSEKRTVTTIPLGGEYPIAVDRENKIHELIRKRYGYHVWNAVLALQAKKERVQATEVVEVRADQARLLVSQFGNYWRRAIGPVFDNVAHIAIRGGRMPAPPAELQDAMKRDIIKPVFIGPLQQLQIQTSRLSGLQQGLSMLKDMAEILGRHIGPEEAAKLYARVRLEDLAEYICDNTGFPQKLMNDDETTAAIIAAREQRTAALEEAKAARELAAASGQLAKEPGQGSLLERAVA